MIIVLHFDGLLGIYEKPFFNTFSEKSESFEGFSEKYIFTRRDLKKIIHNISKIYIVIIIFH